MKSKTAIVFGIIAISFSIAIYFYPKMPDVMVTHWGMYGEPNGYSSKLFGLFLMPTLSVLIYALLLFMPRLDPLKDNVEKFKPYFENFVVLIMLFFFYTYLLSLFWNLGFRFNLVQFLTPAFSILFYYTSTLLEKSKRNWFIGIKTPWTVSNDAVWDKTHILGAKLFKLSAGISLVGLFFPNFTFYLVIGPVIIFSLYLFLYSYLEFQKL